PQLPADQREHRVVFGPRQVPDPDQGWIQPAAGRAAHQQRQLAATAPCDELDLAAETVAGVQYQVETWRQQRLQVRRRQEAGDGIDLDQRIDLPATLRHRFDLGAPELSLVRRQLPIAV